MVRTSKLPGRAAGSTSAKEWLEPPQPQDLVITLLADNVRHRKDEVWSGGLVRLLGDFGFSAGASRVALARLVQRGLISRVKSGRMVAYRLTDRSELLMREGDRRIFGLGNNDFTDHVITVLWHTLGEEHRLKRARLARRLRFLGFGPVQDATWIAAGDHQEELVDIISDLGIADFSGALVGHPPESLNLRPLIERTWDLPALQERYSAFVRMFESVGTASWRCRLSDEQAFRVRTRMMHTFRQFPSLDPSIKPGSPQRTRAISLFREAYDSLREGAHRHFDLIVARPQADHLICDPRDEWH